MPLGGKKKLEDLSLREVCKGQPYTWVPLEAQRSPFTAKPADGTREHLLYTTMTHANETKHFLLSPAVSKKKKKKKTPDKPYKYENISQRILYSLCRLLTNGLFIAVTLKQGVQVYCGVNE